MDGDDMAREHYKTHAEFNERAEEKQEEIKRMEYNRETYQLSVGNIFFEYGEEGFCYSLIDDDTESGLIPLDSMIHLHKLISDVLLKIEEANN